LDGLISMACPVAIFGALLTTSRQAQRRALRRRPRPPDLRKRDAFPSGPRFPLRTSLPPQGLASPSGPRFPLRASLPPQGLASPSGPRFNVRRSRPPFPKPDDP
jgi:hypothetical protein